MSNTPRTRVTTGTRTARARPVTPPPLKLKFMGAEYRLADKIGVWPMMQFARAAESGLTVRDGKGLAAVHAYLEQVIHEDDWAQFQDDMISKKADNMDALMNLITDAVTAVSERQAKNGRRPAARGAVVAGKVEDEPED
jgi:hypothetical protein